MFEIKKKIIDSDKLKNICKKYINLKDKKNSIDLNNHNTEKKSEKYIIPIYEENEKTSKVNWLL